MATVVATVREPSAVEGLEPEWTALASSCSARHFAWPYWCLPWWRHLGRGRLHVVTVRDDGDLVALAPLHVRLFGPVRAVRFLGHGLGTVSEMLVDPDHPEAAVALWREVLAPSDAYVDLIDFPEEGIGLAALRAEYERSVRVRPRGVCPYVPVHGTFDTYFAERSSQLLRILRRSARALEARGATFRVEVVTDAARVDELLPELTRVFDEAEAKNPRHHLLAPPWAAFTRDLMREAARADSLRLFVGFVDEQLAVFAMTFRHERSIAMWLNRFDPAFADVGPGHLVFKEMVRYGFEHGVERVDFLLGDYRYKRLWCGASTDTLLVMGARHRWVRAAGRGAFAAVAALQRHRETPN